jgi:hypothetical protein
MRRDEQLDEMFADIRNLNIKLSEAQADRDRYKAALEKIAELEFDKEQGCVNAEYDCQGPCIAKKALDELTKQSTNEAPKQLCQRCGEMTHDVIPTCYSCYIEA